MATKNFNVKNGLTTGSITLDASTNTTTTSNLVATGNVSFTGSNVSLGAVGNLKITGGTNGYFLQTDGFGTLSWAAPGTIGNISSISNGTSNVNIPVANGNVLISVAGNANIVTVTGTGANISGYTNITGNIVVGTGLTMTSGNANFDSGVLFVDGTNNRVGVGLTNPAYKLDVSGEARVAGTLHFLSVLRNYSSDMILNQSIDANMLFYTNNAEKMRITNTGNVGIGTNNPAYKLEVNGAFAATTKSFVIDHPTKPDMKLRYGSLEGPENGVYVRGRNKGDTIKLPDYWTGLVDEFSITVNLTPIGSHQKLYVKSIENNTVIVGGGFFDEMEYFYTVFAERKDVDKLVVEI